MKRCISLLCVLALLISACGCLGLFGGKNQRELGNFAQLLTADGKDYLEYRISFNSGYVEIGENSYKLTENINFTEKKSDTKVIFSAYATLRGDGIDCEEGYEYLSEQICELLGDTEVYFEAKIFKNGDEIYGALNQYNRSSGRSGNLLCNEDLKKSYLLRVQDERLEILEESDDTAIMAFNQTSYIAYKDKLFYSVNIENGRKTEICKDIWWDNGPTFYSNVNIYYTDDIFMLCGDRKGKHMSLIVGKIDGSYTQTLIDNEEY